MTPDLLMGLDVGTSRTKAVVIRAADRAVVAVAAAATPWRSVPEGEDLDPGQLAMVVADVVTAAAADAGGPIAALGVTGMGESGVLVDGRGRPLGPVWAWHDSRCDVTTVRRATGEDAFRLAVGMRLDAQPSLPKILRLREVHPAARQAVRFHSVPEWVVRRLGGDPGSELSLASRTGLLDVRNCVPWPAAVDLVGRDLLGPLTLAGTPAGRVSGDLPAGLRGAVLTVAGHDHQVAALAALPGGGGERDEALFDSLGTAEALVRFTRTRPRDAEVEALVTAGVTVGRTVLDGQFCLLGGLRTGQALARVAAVVGWSPDTAEAGPDPAGTRGATGSGSGSAVQVVVDPTGEVVMTLSGAATPAQAWAATVRAATAAAVPQLDAVAVAVGPYRVVTVGGGWAANPDLLRAKREQFPGLLVSPLSEPGAVGAARLAGAAADVLPPFVPSDPGRRPVPPVEVPR